jgi:hypothetical protein
MTKERPLVTMSTEKKINEKNFRDQPESCTEKCNSAISQIMPIILCWQTKKKISHTLSEGFCVLPAEIKIRRTQNAKCEIQSCMCNTPSGPNATFRVGTTPNLSVFVVASYSAHVE